jgi:hypothetical protein
MMAFLRSDRDDLAELIDLLRRTEVDAAEACSNAAREIRDEPLTRGTLLSFLAEHEQHRRALEGVLPSLGRYAGKTPTGMSVDPAKARKRPGTTAVLAVIRRNAEVAVRRYQAALRAVPEPLEPLIRAQCNAWLRHRAWLTARIDAFARTRGSHPSLA